MRIIAIAAAIAPVTTLLVLLNHSLAFGQLELPTIPPEPQQPELQPHRAANATEEEKLRWYIKTEYDLQNVLNKKLVDEISYDALLLFLEIGRSDLSQEQASQLMSDLINELTDSQLRTLLEVAHSIMRLDNLSRELHGKAPQPSPNAPQISPAS
jgi:hypothetical protein